MKQDKFGQIVYTPDEVFDIVMHEINPSDENFKPGPFMIADPSVDAVQANKAAGYEALIPYTENNDLTVKDFDEQNQKDWYMPESYKEMDIAKYILDLCENDAQLQRCGEELLLYAEKDLLDLLCYMKYLVDVMELNNVIWGVGRGSSVSSYVLYKLKVHKIDSIYYNLDVREFLR
jgi:DNA polymerase III alpha subunit